MAFENSPIDRYLFARSHAEPVANLHLTERHVGFAAHFVKPFGRLRSQTE